jgi:hypothetical protein
MRRTTTLKLGAAGVALAALSIGGATAFAETDDPEPAAVVNKNGHEVNEHAAHGQERAAEARAQRLEKAAERDAEDSETEEPVAPEADETEAPVEEPTDNGNHGGPNEHAGDHPNPKAFENPQEHEPQGPKEGHEPQGPKDGHGPNENAGDHPNENATNGPGNNGQGHQK